MTNPNPSQLNKLQTLLQKVTELRDQHAPQAGEDPTADYDKLDAIARDIEDMKDDILDHVGEEDEMSAPDGGEEMLPLA